MSRRLALRSAIGACTGLLGATCFAACYLVTPYEDLTSGAGAAASPDATTEAGGADASLAAGAEASADADSAASPLDAGPDAAPTWCTLVHPDATFCDDFDRNGGSISPLWQRHGGPLQILAADTAESSSAPASLEVSIVADAGVNDFPYLLWQPADDDTPTTVFVAFDVRLDLISCCDPTYAMKVAFGEATIALWATDGNSNFYEYVKDPTGTGDTMRSDALGWRPTSSSTWYHLEDTITILPDGGPGSYTFVAEGGAPQTVIMLAGFEPATTQVQAGFTQVNSELAARTIHLDNFVVYTTD